MFAGTPGRAARLRRLAIVIATALAGIGTAALVSVAVARTFTLNIAKNAKVTNTKQVTTLENIVVNSHAMAAYALTGDSRSHPKCTKANGCYSFWLPIHVSSVSKLSKASGISGRLAGWRHNGYVQATLGGHPLYTFVLDKNKDHATGEGVVSFKGTWHVIKTSASNPAMTTTTTTTPTTTTTSTTTAYPPGY